MKKLINLIMSLFGKSSVSEKVVVVNQIDQIVKEEVKEVKKMQHVKKEEPKPIKKKPGRNPGTKKK